MRTQYSKYRRKNQAGSTRLPYQKSKPGALLDERNGEWFRISACLAEFRARRRESPSNRKAQPSDSRLKASASAGPTAAGFGAAVSAGGGFMLNFCSGFRGVRILIAACRDVQFTRDIGVCLPRHADGFHLAAQQHADDQREDARRKRDDGDGAPRAAAHGVPEAASERNSSQPERKP